MEVKDYKSWALQDIFDAFTAAALWCGKNPYYCGSWDGALFSQISILAISIVKQQLLAENYPDHKRDVVLLELGKILGQDKLKFIETICKFTFSREQLKAIAEKKSVKPEFLFSNDSHIADFPSKNVDLESERNDELYLAAPNEYQRNINLSIDDLINKPVSELLSLSRRTPERKPTLVAVADTENEAMQKLVDLVVLEDFKQKLEKELSRVQSVSYQFEETRKADLNQIKAKLEEINRQLSLGSNHTEISGITVGENNDAETVDTDPVPASFKQENQRKRGPTKITVFLASLCQQMEDVTAEKLVRAIRPLVGNSNCPVKKYHGFYDEVCVEWKPGSGSAKGTWGKKAFQNFVGEFKKKGGPKGCQD
jgi:hypothetical protein